MKGGTQSPVAAGIRLHVNSTRARFKATVVLVFCVDVGLGINHQTTEINMQPTRRNVKGGQSVATKEPSLSMDVRTDRGLWALVIYRVHVSLGINYQTSEVEMTFAGSNVKGAPPVNGN